MKRVMHGALMLTAALILLFAPRHASAQSSAETSPFKQVVSANPFGLLINLFNGEYERVVSGYSTAGVGGSTFSNSGFRYVNADAFWRYYPTGKPLDGWAFGLKAGITYVKDSTYTYTATGAKSAYESKSFFGYGFDANRSWLLGKKNNFYVGIGFGLKKLVGANRDYAGLQYIPTFRIVNIGFAF